MLTPTSTLTAPLDVVKIRLQLQVDGDKYKGILRTMRTIAAEESAFGLWKGNVPASAMYVIYGATQFTTYSVCNNWLSKWEREYGVDAGPGVHSFVLGCVAGCTSTVVSYPFDLLRTRLANSPSFLNLYTTVGCILKEEGTVGFFKGCRTAMVSLSLYTGLMFWCYETSRIVASSINMYPSIVEPVCGFGAGVFAKAVVFPLDLVRRRIQVDTKKSKSLWKTMESVVKGEGVRALYKGFTVSLIKNAPASAISLWSFEYVIRMID